MNHLIKLKNFQKASFIPSLNSLHYSSQSFWAGVPLGPRDPILGISEAFKTDPSPLKMNLGVGAYRDDKGKPMVLECVRQAEALLPSIYNDKEYLSIEGLKDFNKVCATLAYTDEIGSNTESSPGSLNIETIAVCQSLSGTGALRIGGEYLKRFAKNKQIYVPAPTWGNHHAIFKDCGLTVSTYRYWDEKRLGLGFEDMLADLEAAPSGSVVLLHACAHNPTGVDPTPGQWKAIQELVERKGHTAFFDMAYQGFASGDIHRDAVALRRFFNSAKVPILLAQSFAKNFGLYGERVGALSLPCATQAEKEAVLSQLKIIARPMYSNPPLHGARLVTTILQHQELTGLWLNEVKAMADRIISMRTALRSEVEALGSPHNWSHITSQIGMFCYTGLSAAQVERLTNEFHVYLTKDGRISMAGVTTGNVKNLAKAINQVSK